MRYKAIVGGVALVISAGMLYWVLSVVLNLINAIFGLPVGVVHEVIKIF